METRNGLVCIGSETKEPISCTSVFSFREVHDIDPITTLECSENSFCSDSKSNIKSDAINEFNKKVSTEFGDKVNLTSALSMGLLTVCSVPLRFTF